jgi:hypothetical protein
MSQQRNLALVLLVAGVAANGAARRLAAQSTAPAIRDSAGVRIVTYRSLQGAVNRIHVEPSPYLDIGGVRPNPEEELESRHPWLSATSLDDGTIVVNDVVQLKFFTPDGRFIRSAGRRGQGPGEFRQTREVCRLPGDTLLAIDYSDGRMTLWDRTGTHIRTVSRPGWVPFNSCFSDGTFIAQVLDSASASGSGTEYVREHVRVRLDGTVVNRLGPLPISEYTGPVMREVSVSSAGNEVYVGDARTFEVRVLSLDGRVRRIIRVNEPPRRITEAEWRRLAERSVPPDASAEWREQLIGMTMAMKRPATYPAYAQVRSDGLKRIWIQGYEDRSAWTVFDSTGAFLGHLNLEGAYRGRGPKLVGIGRDHVVLLRTDDDGAAHLTFHRLTASALR